MHPSSMTHMKAFRDKYLRGLEGLTVIDVGSLDINGSYRDLFSAHEYTGLDVVKGKNVDMVLKAPCKWDEVRDGSVDVVISGQAFEHIKYDNKVMAEVARSLKPGGHCCIIAPSAGPLYEVLDYRRYQATDMRNLAEGAGLEVVECGIRPAGSPVWRDCVLIAEKPKAKKKAKARISKPKAAEKPKTESGKQKAAAPKTNTNPKK